MVRLVCKGTQRVLAYGNGYSENSVSNFEVLIEIDLNARILKRDGLTYKNVEISDSEVSTDFPEKEYIERITVNRITGAYKGNWRETKLVPGVLAGFYREGRCSPTPEKLF